MRKRWKIGGLILIAGLIVIQFFQPEKNQGSKSMETDLIAVVSIPDSLAVILRKACYDCHSNHTAYPWYNKISPLSWYIHKHVKEGKADLNLSLFGTLDKAAKIGALSDIYDVVEAGTMPLQGFLIIHKDAKLSEDEIEAICNWADQTSLSVMKE